MYVCIKLYTQVTHIPQISERVGDPLDKLSSSKRCASMVENSKQGASLSLGSLPGIERANKLHVNDIIGKWLLALL